MNELNQINFNDQLFKTNIQYIAKIHVKIQYFQNINQAFYYKKLSKIYAQFLSQKTIQKYSSLCFYFSQVMQNNKQIFNQSIKTVDMLHHLHKYNQANSHKHTDDDQFEDPFIVEDISSISPSLKTAKNMQKLIKNNQYFQQYTDYLQSQVTRLKMHIRNQQTKFQQKLAQLPNIQLVYTLLITKNQQLTLKNRQLLQKYNKLEYKYAKNIAYYTISQQYYQDQLRRVKNNQQLFIFSIQELEHALRQYLKQKQHNQIYICKLRQQLQVMIKNIAQLTQQKSQLMKQLNNIKMHLSQLQSDRNGLINVQVEYETRSVPEFRKNSKNNYFLSKKLSEKDSLNDQLDRQMPNLNKTLKKKISYEQHNFIVNKIRKQYEQFINNFTKQLSIYKHKNRQFQIRIQKMTSQMDNNILQLEQQLMDLRETCDKIDNLKLQNKDLKYELKIQKYQNEKLENNLQRQTERNKKLKQQNKSLLAKLEILQPQKQALSQHNIRQHAESYFQKYNDLLQKSKKLQSDLQKTRGNQNILKSTLNNLTVEFNKLKKYMNNLKSLQNPHLQSYNRRQKNKISNIVYEFHELPSKNI